MTRSVELGGVTEHTSPGTRIALVDDRGVVHVTYTRSEPWYAAGRQLLVLVVGRAGGYRASRCWVLPDEALEVAKGDPVP